MNAFARSWEVSKATFSVMLKNKKMFWFVILDIILSISAFIPALIFGLMLAIIAPGENLPVTILIIFILIGYFIAYFFTVFADVAVVYTAKREFENSHANTGEILKFTFSRLKAIISWTLINGTVGLVLKMSKGKGGDTSRNRGFNMNSASRGLMGSLLGAAWSILIVFVIPSIVYENKGSIHAIKTSFNTVKETWGELLIRWFGLGMVQGLVTTAGFLLFGFIGFIGFDFGITPLLIFAIVSFFLFSVSVTIIFAIANQVFDTALYEYVHNKKIPSGYTEENLKNAFMSPSQLFNQNQQPNQPSQFNQNQQQFNQNQQFNQFQQ